MGSFRCVGGPLPNAPHGWEQGAGDLRGDRCPVAPTWAFVTQARDLPKRGGGVFVGLARGQRGRWKGNNHVSHPGRDVSAGLRWVRSARLW